MKRLFALLNLLPALVAEAQTQPAAAPANIGVTRRYIGSDTPPEQLADERASLMVGQLGLSPDQATQVRAAELTRAQARQAKLRRLEADPSHPWGFIPLNAEDRAIDAQFETQLQAICTPAQYQRHQVIQARFRRLRARTDSLSHVPQGAVTPK